MMLLLLLQDGDRVEGYLIVCLVLCLFVVQMQTPEEQELIKEKIKKRENQLMPVYTQVRR